MERNTICPLLWCLGKISIITALEKAVTCTEELRKLQLTNQLLATQILSTSVFLSSEEANYQDHYKVF